MTTSDLKSMAKSAVFRPKKHRQRRRSSSVRFPPNPAEVIATVDPCCDMPPEVKSSVWYDSREVAGFKNAIRTASAKIRLSARQRAEDERTAGTCEKQVQLLRHYRSKDEKALACATIARRACAASQQQRCPDEGGGGERGGEQSEEAADPTVETRGLEQRTSFERQRNKFFAIRSVLAWQRRLKARGASAAAAQAADANDDDDDTTSRQLAEITSRVSQYARQVATETGKADFYRAYPDLLSRPAEPLHRSPSPTAAMAAPPQQQQQSPRLSITGKRKSISEDSVPSLASSELSEENGGACGTVGEGRQPKRRSITQPIVVGLSTIALAADVSDEED